MGLKTVVLLTERYPSRSYTEEVFIDPDISALSQRFDRVIVVPHEIRGEMINVGYPNVIIDLTVAKSFYTRRRWSRLLWLTRPWVWCQTFKVLKEAQSFASFLSGMFYLMNTRRAARYLKSIINKYGLKESDTIFYSFWFDCHVDACLFFKEFKVVTRAHNHDIFDSQIKQRLHYLRSMSLKNLNNVYCASDDGANYLRSSYPEYSLKIKTKFLGSKRSKKTSPVPDSNRDTMTFFSCSRVEPVKRVELCFKTVLEVAKSLPDKHIIWHHIGGGTEFIDLFDTVKSSLKLFDNLSVNLYGPLPNEDVRKFYESTYIDWFMLLSTIEGLPIALTESISYGVPVIATDAGGNAEIVTDKTGILVPIEFEVKDIVDKILFYYNNKKEYLSLRRDAYNEWSQRFDAELLRRDFVKELYSMV